MTKKPSNNCFAPEIKKFGDPLQGVFYKEDSSISENLIVFVNGKKGLTEKGLKTVVKDRDYIIISTILQAIRDIDSFLNRSLLTYSRKGDDWLRINLILQC